jgi:hypothetical protein
MTEPVTHMLIADPEMIGVLSMTPIILKTRVRKEDMQRIAGSKTSDGMAALE